MYEIGIITIMAKIKFLLIQRTLISIFKIINISSSFYVSIFKLYDSFIMKFCHVFRYWFFFRRKLPINFIVISKSYSYLMKFI